MATDPKLLLEEMCRNANPRKERSLRLIYSICEEQHERGSKDFSVATVGRLSGDRGGPSAAAIRNKTGEDYRALMKAFADSVGGRSRKVAASVNDKADEVLEGITDPVIRTRINLLLAEVESLRGQLLATRYLANQNACIVLGGAAPAAAGGDDRVEVITNTGIDLTTLEKRALQGAISDKTLKHWGWEKDNAGRVLSESGQVIFGAGFIGAVEKVLAATK